MTVRRSKSSITEPRRRRQILRSQLRRNTASPNSSSVYAGRRSAADHRVLFLSLDRSMDSRPLASCRCRMSHEDIVGHDLAVIWNVFHQKQTVGWNTIPPAKRKWHDSRTNHGPKRLIQNGGQRDRVLDSIPGLLKKARNCVTLQVFASEALDEDRPLHIPRC